LPAVGEARLLQHDPRSAAVLLAETRVPATVALPDPTEAAWSLFHGRLVAFVSRRVGDPADAEDIVQQVFLRMHRGGRTLRNAGAVGAWLHRTARNAIVDHYRTPARRRERPAGDTRDLDVREAPSPVGAGEADTEGAACAMECLRPMIDRLPDAYRRAIVRVEIEGMTQSRAAVVEGLSLSGMKARVQRARQRLKTLLLERCRIALDARGAPVGCEDESAPGGPCRPPDRKGEG
jgi:RNA polymerase sigma-70 factor (ECF subfamily)